MKSKPMTFKERRESIKKELAELSAIKKYLMRADYPLIPTVIHIGHRELWNSLKRERGFDRGPSKSL